MTRESFSYCLHSDNGVICFENCRECRKSAQKLRLARTKITGIINTVFRMTKGLNKNTIFHFADTETIGSESKGSYHGGILGTNAKIRNHKTSRLSHRVSKTRIDKICKILQKDLLHICYVRSQECL